MAHTSGRVQFLSAAPRCATSTIGGSKALRLLAKVAPNDLQELDRAIGLGDVAIATRRSRLLLIALHGKRAHGDDRRCTETRQRLDLPGRIVAIEHGQLNVHEDEIWMLRARFGDALYPVDGFNHGV